MSGNTALPGGATIPGGSYISDTTSMMGALQARTGSVNGSVPLPRDHQFYALMGPGSPLYPAPLNIPNPSTGQADPRRWQYPISWNLTQDDGRLVNWTVLRQTARDVDLIAQCIRLRRTEQSSLEWDITLSRRCVEANGVKSTEDKNRLLDKYSDHIGRLIDFWSMPDTTNDYNWTEWLEMLMQEQLVLDAVAIYPRFTYGGDLVSLELVDGATIKPLLDERGNRPRPPAAAYQQWLYGFPRGEYTSTQNDDPDWQGAAGSIIYKPRFTRVNSPYGYSPVEQALVSAELWMRRQQWMVAEYRDGTTPRSFLKATGLQMTPEQIRAWEDSLNDFYGGSTSNRHRLRLLPEGFDPTIAEDAAERYKPDYDEFLVKLICGHMDVQPQEIGFTPRNGLGGSGHGETQEAITYRKALRPTAQWLVELMNQISYAYLDMPRDLTFQFLGLDSEDEQSADLVLEKQLRSGRRTLNECRDERGLSRYDFNEADMPMLLTERGVVFLEGASELVEPGELVGPVQAPPLKGPPEGPNANPNVPIVATREAQASGQSVAQQRSEQPQQSTQDSKGQQSSKVDDGESDVVKAELAAFWRWHKKGQRSRPFEFTTVTKTVAMLNEVPLDRVLFKVGDVAPKVLPGPPWPGWEHDLAVASHYAPRITAALTGAVDAYTIAKQWFTVHKADKNSPLDALNWLDAQNIPLAATLTPLLTHLYIEGAYVGQQAAQAMLGVRKTTGTRTDWGAWTPGHPEAAQALIGDNINLQRLLADGDVIIHSIAQHRLGDLAQVLADGLANGDNIDTLTDAVRGVLDDTRWANLVALTETTRAVSWATQQTYLANGITSNSWLTALDQRVCVACDQNEASGPVPVGTDFPSGQTMPPAHPACRCALIPTIE